jgi:hypothetical protein
MHMNRSFRCSRKFSIAFVQRPLVKGKNPVQAWQCEVLLSEKLAKPGVGEGNPFLRIESLTRRIKRAG